LPKEAGKEVKAMAEYEKINVGILIFNDVEVLDFCGPFEVFSMASMVAKDIKKLDDGAFGVFTVAEYNRTVKARGNLLVQPHFTIDDHPPIDILVVPGGWGTRQEINNPTIINWISSVAKAGNLTTSVCTGSFLLGKAGLLEGKKVTTHWASLARMAEAFPSVTVEKEVRWVDEDKIITSAGVSAGIDMSLHVVGRLHGREVALTTAKQMEYDWRA
jgi:transcriptional regulator GlxA family with amidase domain